MKSLPSFGRALFLAAAFLLLLIPDAQAQRRQGGGQGMSPELMRERLEIQVEQTIEEMDLSEAQVPTVRAILMASADRRITMMEQAGGNRSREGREAMREAMQASEEETQLQLAAILDEAQLAQYLKVVEERASQRRQGRGRQGGQ